MRELNPIELQSVSGGYFQDPGSILSANAPIPITNNTGLVIGYVQQVDNFEGGSGYSGGGSDRSWSDVNWEAVGNIAEGAQDLGTAAAAAGGLIIIADGPLPFLDAAGVPLAVGGGILTIAGLALEGVADFGSWMESRSENTNDGPARTTPGGSNEQ